MEATDAFTKGKKREATFLRFTWQEKKFKLSQDLFFPLFACCTFF